MEDDINGSYCNLGFDTVRMFRYRSDQTPTKVSPIVSLKIYICSSTLLPPPASVFRMVYPPPDASVGVFSRRWRRRKNAPVIAVKLTTENRKSWHGNPQQKSQKTGGIVYEIQFRCVGGPEKIDRRVWPPQKGLHCRDLIIFIIVKFFKVLAVLSAHLFFPLF